MTNTGAVPRKKMTKRGKIVISAFTSVLLLIIGIVISLPQDNLKNCVFKPRSSSSQTSDQTSVVLMPTSNFVDFASIVSRAENEIKESIGNNLPSGEKANALNRELSIVLGDSSPILISNTFVDPQVASADREQEINDQIDITFKSLEKALGCAGGVKASPGDEVSLDAETDVLKAITVASNQFSHSGKRNLFMLGNGIQTSGAIHMQDSDSFPKNSKTAIAMATSLYQSGNLPDLSGVHVKWYGLGQVDGSSQKTLPTSWAKALRTFWEKVIALSGGTVDSICEQCGSGLPQHKTIQVSEIKISECPLIVKLYENDGVEFKPDSAAFVSVDKAKAAAKSTVERFNAKGCKSMTVTGFAAAGKSKSAYEADKETTDETNSTLTESRAKAFSSLLRNAGFAGDITYIGAGTCGTEWDGNGQVDTELQRLCRRVEVTS